MSTSSEWQTIHYWERETGDVRRCRTEEEYEQSRGISGRFVAGDTIEDADHEVRVSTVFVPYGLYSGFYGAELWFETAVFVNGENVETARFSTADQAMAAHAKMCRIWLHSKDGCQVWCPAREYTDEEQKAVTDAE